MMGVNLPAQSPQPPSFQPISWQLGSNTILNPSSGNPQRSGGGTTTWNAGATSLSTDPNAPRQILRDGGLEIRLNNLNGNSRFAVGLSVRDTSLSFSSIDFAWLIRPVSTSLFNTSYTAQIYIDGDPVGSTTPCTQSTILSITRQNGQIVFLKDSTPVQLPSNAPSVTSSGTLFADCSIDVGTIGSCFLYTGDLDKDGMPDAWETQNLPPNAGWTDLQNFLHEPASPPVPGEPFIARPGDPDADGVSNLQEFLDGTNPNNALSYMVPVSWTALPSNTELVAGGLGGIKKKAGIAAGWTAGGISTQKILEDGQLTFRAPLGSSLAVGLSDIDAGQTQTDLDFAFILATNNTVTIKRPEYTTNLAIGEYTAETVFCLQRIAGRVQFLKDGVVYATSDRTASSGRLQADCSLNAINAQITECRIYTGDLDSDTLPDSWEQSHLPPNATYLDLEVFAPGLDIPTSSTNPQLGEDNDGRTVLQEWVEGTNPLEPLSVSTPVKWAPSTNATASTFPATLNEAPVTKQAGGSTTWNADAISFENGAEKRLFHSGKIIFSVGTTKTLAVGLTIANTTRDLNDLEYAIYCNAAGQAFAYESGVQKEALGPYDANTSFAIQRLAGSIAFLKDGIIYYTSKVPSTVPLLIDTSLYHVGATITSARMHTGDIDGDQLPDEWELALLKRRGDEPTFANLQNLILPTGHLDTDDFTNLEEYKFGTDPLQGIIKPIPISWINRFNTSLQGLLGGLKKTAGTTGTFNADATSEIALPGDGRWNFTAAPNALAFGLTYTNNSRAETDLEYAFVLSSTNAAIRRPESTTNLSTGAYTQSTIFGLQQFGSQIDFLRDGLVVYSSTEPVTSFLRADCSISTLNHQFDAVYQNSPDLDNDGLPDEWELRYLPLNATWQQLLDSHPNSHGSDNDNINLWTEYLNGTSPASPDSDEDGMSDTWEILNGLAANDPTNTTTDLDGDGLSNLAELQNQTSPTIPDTDSDGIWDGYEVDHSLLPLDPNDALLDKDGDRIPNVWEFTRLTSASNPTSIPSTDATVDPTLTNDDPDNHRYRTLNSAYNALPTDLAYRSIIRVLPGIHNLANISNDTTGDVSNPYAKKIAILGQVPDATTTPPTFATLASVWLVANTDLYLDGLVLQNSLNSEPAVRVKMAPYNAYIGGGPLNPQYITEYYTNPNVRIVNCLFRNFAPTVSGDFTRAGAVFLESGKVSIEHCTFLNCGPRASSSQTTYPSIWAPNGGISLKNSIVWDTGNGTHSPSLTPVDFGPTPESYSVTSCLIQGGAYNSLSSNPNLSPDGWITLQSTACFAAGSATTVPKDILLQLRPATTADLGPIQWLTSTRDTDSDGLPDHWEFANNLDLAIANDPALDTDGDGMGYLQEFWAGTNPSLSDTDGDGHLDSDELRFGSNPLNPNSTPALAWNIVSGNDQTVFTGQVTPQPLMVRASKGSLPSVGQSLTLTTTQGDLSLSPEGPWLPSLVLTTGPEGTIATYWRAPTQTGLFSVTAIPTSSPTSALSIPIFVVAQGGNAGGSSGGTNSGNNSGVPVTDSTLQWSSRYRGLSANSGDGWNTEYDEEGNEISNSRYFTGSYQAANWRGTVKWLYEFETEFNDQDDQDFNNRLADVMVNGEGDEWPSFDPYAAFELATYDAAPVTPDPLQATSTLSTQGWRPDGAYINSSTEWDETNLGFLGGDDNAWRRIPKITWRQIRLEVAESASEEWQRTYLVVKKTELGTSAVVFPQLDTQTEILGTVRFRIPRGQKTAWIDFFPSNAGTASPEVRTQYIFGLGEILSLEPQLTGPALSAERRGVSIDLLPVEVVQRQLAQDGYSVEGGLAATSIFRLARWQDAWDTNWLTKPDFIAADRDRVQIRMPSNAFSNSGSGSNPTVKISCAGDTTKLDMNLNGGFYESEPFLFVADADDDDSYNGKAGLGVNNDGHLNDQTISAAPGHEVTIEFENTGSSNIGPLAVGRIAQPTHTISCELVLITENGNVAPGDIQAIEDRFQMAAETYAQIGVKLAKVGAVTGIAAPVEYWNAIANRTIAYDTPRDVNGQTQWFGGWIRSQPPSIGKVLKVFFLDANELPNYPVNLANGTTETVAGFQDLKFALVCMDQNNQWHLTLAHEIGHFVGLGHPNGERNLMSIPHRPYSQDWLDSKRFRFDDERILKTYMKNNGF